MGRRKKQKLPYCSSYECPTKNEIIKELYDTKFVGNYLRKISFDGDDEEMMKDMESELWVLICEISEERLKEFYCDDGINRVRKFVSGIIWRSCCSKCGETYRKFVKTKNFESFDFEKQEHIECYNRYYRDEI